MSRLKFVILLAATSPTAMADAINVPANVDEITLARTEMFIENPEVPPLEIELYIRNRQDSFVNGESIAIPPLAPSAPLRIPSFADPYMVPENRYRFIDSAYPFAPPGYGGYYYDPFMASPLEFLMNGDARLIIRTSPYASPGSVPPLDPAIEMPKLPTLLTSLLAPQDPTIQIDPVTGLPLDPYAGGGIDPATGWPLDPISGFPMDPATGFIYDPMTGMAVDPVSGLPLDPITGFPMDPMTGQLIDPATGMPIDPALIPPPMIDPLTGQLIFMIPPYPGPIGGMLPPPPMPEPVPVNMGIDTVIPAQYITRDKHSLTLNINTCDLPTTLFGEYCGPIAIVWKYNGMEKVKYKASSTQTQAPGMGDLERETKVSFMETYNATHMYGHTYTFGYGSLWTMKTSVSVEVP